MDDSQEPSYYEIALTNRQVLVFFVVLLVCVVGAFFSGIWLGQQRTVSRPAVAETSAEEPVQEEGGEALAELNFFTDEETPPTTRPASNAAAGEAAKPKQEPRRAAAKKEEPVAAVGSPGTTLLEDLNGSEASTSARESPVESVAASPSSAASTASEGGFVIQVFSSPDGEQARKVLDRLTSGGYEAFISPVEVDGRVMHRVRVGPFSERDAAESAASRVKSAYSLDTWVTAND